MYLLALVAEGWRTITEAFAGALMPYVFDFDLHNGILRCRLSGQVTDATLREFFRVGAGYSLRTRPRAGVVDFSDVASFDVSAQTIEELAKTLPLWRDPDLRRIVIAPSPQIFGLMRMFEMESEQHRPDLQVVRTERDAWAILAIENPKFEPLT